MDGGILMDRDAEWMSMGGGGGGGTWEGFWSNRIYKRGYRE